MKHGERDLRHPPIETAYGIRVGDVIELYRNQGTVVEMRTGYATGSGGAKKKRKPQGKSKPRRR